MDHFENIEHYKAIAQHYWENANGLMEAGEHLKASELYWGFVSQEILAFASMRGIGLGNHRKFAEFCTDLSKATNDPYFKDEFKALNALHVSFYHSLYDLSEVRTFAIKARHFAERLWSLQE